MTYWPFILIGLFHFFSTVLGKMDMVVTMSQENDTRSGKAENITLKYATTHSFGFASYYSDHMVLQRAPKRAVIWGYAMDIGERIIIKMSERGIYTTKVYKDPVTKYGVWKIKLPAEASAGPFTITAMSSEKTITLQDVMFGDVWICSGQSNMQFTLKQGFNATAEVNDANNFPHIRLFTVADVPSKVPIPDFRQVLEKWNPASKASVGGAPWKYFSAVCWLYGKALYKELGYPIGLIDTTWGGTIVEAWSPPEALAKCNADDTPFTFDPEQVTDMRMIKGQNDHSALWNGMVHPLINMTIYGAIWYQGEANQKYNVDKYNCTFPAMIDSWRLLFNNGSDNETDPMFPFGFVQLAPNHPYDNGPGFSEVRWHQTADYGYVPNPRMKNVFMAVALDLPDFSSPWTSIHPRDKQDVAARLSLSGFSVAYKQKGIVFQGPLPYQIVEGSSNISLLYNTSILYHNLVGFEALCPVKNSSLTFWTILPVMSPQPNRLIFWGGVCGKGETIRGVRYLWEESPCPFKSCTVYSADNPQLPGPPFILYKKMSGKRGTVHTLDWNTPVALNHCDRMSCFTLSILFCFSLFNYYIY